MPLFTLDELKLIIWNLKSIGFGSCEKEDLLTAEIGKGFEAFLFLVFLGLFLLSMLVLAEGSEGKTITVDNDGEGDYESIQEAIDAAEEGDTIHVWDGKYRERINVTKELEFIGNSSGSTIIDGTGGNVVRFSSSN